VPIPSNVKADERQLAVAAPRWELEDDLDLERLLSADFSTSCLAAQHVQTQQ